MGNIINLVRDYWSKEKEIAGDIVDNAIKDNDTLRTAEDTALPYYYKAKDIKH